MRDIVRSEPLLGGMSSIVEREWLRDGSSVVTRTITDSDWLTREPNLIEREAAVLKLLASSAVRAPLLVGTEGATQLTMSFVDGVMVTDGAGLASRAQAIAEVAAEIAAVALPADHDLPGWRSWAAPALEPPDWGNVDLWSKAIECYRATGPTVPEQVCLLHRDLHPLNMLWPVEGLPAVVDWVNARVGHAHAELGHLRWNLTVLSHQEVADQVLAAYLDLTAADGHRTYDPWWDLAPLMSFLPGPIGGSGWHAVGRTDLTPRRVVERTERFLAAALAAS